MYKLFLLIGLILVFIKNSEAVQCQVWTKESGHAVVWGKFQNCPTCSSTIIHRNNALHFEAGCHRGLMTPLDSQCQKDRINNDEIFTCICNTNDCNNYPALLEQAHQFKASQHLKSPLPSLIRSEAMSFKINFSLVLMSIVALVFVY